MLVRFIAGSHYLFLALTGVALLLNSPLAAQPSPASLETFAATATLPTNPPTVMQPEYPGGDAALIRFLGSTLRYPLEAFKDGAEGKVDVSFWIDEQGHPYGFGTVESPHPALAAEALRAMRLMPDWTPGQRNSRPAPMLVHVPVVFRRPANAR